MNIYLEFLKSCKPELLKISHSFQFQQLLTQLSYLENGDDGFWSFYINLLFVTDTGMSGSQMIITTRTVQQCTLMKTSSGPGMI